MKNEGARITIGTKKWGKDGGEETYKTDDWTVHYNFLLSSTEPSKTDSL